MTVSACVGNHCSAGDDGREGPIPTRPLPRARNPRFWRTHRRPHHAPRRRLRRAPVIPWREETRGRPRSAERLSGGRMVNSTFLTDPSEGEVSAQTAFVPNNGSVNNIPSFTIISNRQVKGVGRFTADGVLMVALRRQDIWPAADLALRRAVERVWELEAPASVAEVDAVGERFRPWRTLAAIYIY